MKTVSQSEMAPYNETDHACGGGYYNCPNCGTQLYLSRSQVGDTIDCDYCEEWHEIEE
jgi:hypothetical protein